MNMNGSGNIFINENGIKDDNANNINFRLLKIWNEHVTGEKVDNNRIMAYIAASLTKDKKIRSVTPISNELQYNTMLIKNAMAMNGGTEKKKMAHRIKTKILSRSKKSYFDYFQVNHKNVHPMTWSEISEYCKENNIDQTKLSYDPNTMICLNACQAKDCPHFLKANTKPLRDHLGGWQELLPWGFHAFISRKRWLEDQQIYDQFLVEKNISDFSKYNATMESVLGYIKLVKKAYV